MGMCWYSFMWPEDATKESGSLTGRRILGCEDGWAIVDDSSKEPGSDMQESEKLRS